MKKLNNIVYNNTKYQADNKISQHSSELEVL